MSQKIFSHTQSGPEGAPMRITERTRGNESLVAYFNHRAVLSVSMNPHRGLSIISDHARNEVPGCGRIVWKTLVGGPCYPMIPSRTGCRANAPASRLQRHSPSGRGKKSLRPLSLRVQPRHVPISVLMRIKAGSSFTIRRILCATRWFAWAGMTGITRNRNTRHAKRDAQYMLAFRQFRSEDALATYNTLSGQTKKVGGKGGVYEKRMESSARDNGLGWRDYLVGIGSVCRRAMEGFATGQDQGRGDNEGSVPQLW